MMMDEDLLSQKESSLFKIISDLKSVIICLSGGIDSSFVAWYSLKTLGKANIMAVTAVSPSLSQQEKDHITQFTQEYAIPHQWVQTQEFENPNYLANPNNRCFYCKDELFRQTHLLGQKNNMAVIDGSNYSDLNEVRPGREAAKKWGIFHPLEEARLEKPEIRALAQKAGLPHWDKPASPCLSSRIPHGQTITLESIGKIERAEFLLKKMGFNNFRVRHFDDQTAKIETTKMDLIKITTLQESILQEFLQLGFKNIFLDLKPRPTELP